MSEVAVKPTTNFYFCMSTRMTVYVLCNYCGEEEGVEQEGFEDGEDVLNRTLNKKGWEFRDEETCLLCPDCVKRLSKQPAS